MYLQDSALTERFLKCWCRVLTYVHEIRPQLWHSLGWREFDKAFPEFASVAWYLRLRLSLDGIALFNRYSKRSTWPLMFEMMNLGGAVRGKFEYILLAGLTLPASGSGDRMQPDMEVLRAILHRIIDDFLEPLWGAGLEVSASDGAGKPRHTVVVKGALLSLTADSKAAAHAGCRRYGGYCICLWCLERAVRAAAAALQLGTPPKYMADQRVRLPQGHKLRQLTRPGIWDDPCVGEPRPLLTSEEVRTAGLEVEELRAGKATGELVVDKEQEKGVKMLCALFRLSYWRQAKFVEYGFSTVSSAVPA